MNKFSLTLQNILKYVNMNYSVGRIEILYEN